MPIRTYLCNQFYDKKCHLNGIQPSTRLPWKEKLCQYFSDHIQLSNDQLPLKVDLRSAMTTVEDQSRIVLRIHLRERMNICLKNPLVIILMRAVYLFITTYEQKKENVTTIIDSGCSMTNAIEALEELRTCLESVWPYDISNVNKCPNEEAYDQAKDHQITSALKVNIDLIEMKTCLTQGFPFAFGLRLHKSFDKAAKRGVVPMPDENEQGRNEHGRHAMLYIPYDYMTNSAYYFDVWTVRELENDDMVHENWDDDDSVDYQQEDDENTSSSSSSSAAD